MQKDNKFQNFSKTARNLTQKIVAYAREKGRDMQLDDVEVLFSGLQTTEIQIEDNTPVSSIKGAIEGIYVSLYAGDKSISFKQDYKNLSAVKKAIESNLALLPYVPANADNALADTQYLTQGNDDELDNVDKNAPHMDALIDYACRMEQAIKTGATIKGARTVQISESSYRAYHYTTKGLDVEKGRSQYSAYIAVVAEKDGQMEIDGEYYSAAHFSDLPAAEDIANKAALKARTKLGGVTPDTGAYPIVLDPETAETFFRSVMASIHGENFYNKSTLWPDALGKQILPDDVTIIDDPTIKRSSSSQICDSSGIKSDKLTFIKNGVVQQYNHSLFSARKLGVAPIGRDGGLTNTTVLPGKKSPEDLMKDIKKGIYITAFSGGMVNLQSGTFSRPAQGLWIENGKLTDKPVDGFILSSGDLKAVFKSVAIANDTPAHPRKSSFAAPTTRLNGMTVSGK